MRPNFAFATARFEVLQRPFRPRIAGRRDQQRVVETRFVSHAAALVVGDFRCRSATCEAEPVFLQRLQRVRLKRVAWIRKCGRARNVVLCEHLVQQFNLRRDVLRLERLVIGRVMSDFEAIFVQLSNFVPTSCTASCPTEN